jgi:hypothetical protein
MKIYFLALSVTLMAAACNTSPKTDEPTTLLKSDSTFVIQPELPLVKAEATSSIKTVEKKRVTQRSGSTAGTSTAGSGSTSGTSTANSGSTSGTSNTATQKTGWSKTAKGAVIGGVVGAGTGVIVNKRNRLAGGIIGGVVGAGAGAVIGNEIDKKDGRH